MTRRKFSRLIRKKEKEESKKVEKLVNPWNWYPQTWYKAFVATCVLGVIFDPLFLYVPTINSGEKCLAVDDPMMFMAFALRTLTDFASLVHMYWRFRDAQKMAKQLGLSIATGFPWWQLLFNILSLIPVPQVIVIRYFSKLAGSDSLMTRKILSLFLTLQYAPRLIRVYFSAKELGKSLDTMARQVWVRGAFFFLHYVISAHILGALWYFYATYRETACWHEACKNGKLPGCNVETSFDCKRKLHYKPNLTDFENSCPVSPPNPSVFNFGIFSDAMESKILHNTDFPAKLARCFWWGLANLCSFGANLKTSSDVHENLFAVLISILGLLLFLYLIGNLQMYMQLATKKSEETRRKISLKLPEIDSFLENHNLPPHKKKVVKQYLHYTIKHDKEFDIKRLLALLEEHSEHGHNNTESFSSWVNKILDVKRQDQSTSELKAEIWITRNEIKGEKKEKILRYISLRLTEGKDVDVGNLMSILPSELGFSIKKFLCFPILRKVPTLENMDDNVYETICNYAKPVIYAEKSYVIRRGEPVDLLLLVTQGTLWSFESEIDPTKRIQKGDFWGDEVFEWRLRTTSYSEFPLSKSNLKCHTKVEGFALMAVDLDHVLSNCWAKFSSNSGVFEPFAVASLQKGFRRFIRNKRANGNNNKLAIITSYS